MGRGKCHPKVTVRPLDPALRRCGAAHLPGLQLLREVHLLLDGVQQLAVEGHHVNLALGQLHLHRILPGGRARNKTFDLLLKLF